MCGEHDHASRAAIILGVFAAASLVLGGLSGCSTAGDDGSPATISRADTDLRVFVIGVDGATWRVLDPMIERGELPTFERLLKNGTRAELATLKPTLSSIIWTSVATGKAPHKHGIRGFWREASEGELHADESEKAMIEQLRAIGYIGGEGDVEGGVNKVLYKHSDWKSAALWDVLGEHGLESMVLGWWVTYPVQQINGVMVSDRYLFNRFELESQERGHGYGDDQQNVHPAELEPELRELALSLEDVDAGHLERFLDGPIELKDRVTLHDPIDELRMVLAKDASYQKMAKHLLSQRDPDFFTVYFQGVDIASHYFWKYLFPEEWEERYPDSPIPDEDIERFHNVIPEYYRLMDEYMADLLQQAGEDTLVMVLSDHGFVTGRRKKGSGRARETVSGTHAKSAPPGVLIVSGHGAAAGASLRQASVLDIVPTVLTAMGLPVARDMDGRVLLSALDESAFGHALPVDWVESYEKPEDIAQK
jgi:predicted AlkP superfamily phosphohydrolase/phosphomutase